MFISLHHRAKLNVEELESRIVPAITTGADYAITPSDVTIDIPVLANDFSDGPPLSIISVTQGQYGTVAIDGDTIRYTPAASGPDYFTYSVTDGVDQAFATVYLDVSTAAYDIYHNAVADADQTYAVAVNAAGDERLSAITAARNSSLLAADQAYLDYESLAETARTAFEASIVSAYSNFQTAKDIAWAVWDSAFEQASGTYDAAMVSAQAEFNNAEAITYQDYLSALDAAEVAYSFHVDPFQSDRDSALALFQAAPENPELEQAYLASEAALAIAITEATDIKNSTIANVEDTYEAAQDANNAARTDAEDTAGAAFDVAFTAATDTRLAAEATATSTYDAAIQAAQDTYEVAEADGWDTYLSSLTTLETSLVSTEAAFEAQFDTDLVNALSAWQQSEQSAWDAYQTALSLSPVSQPQARITDPSAAAPAPVDPFAGYVADARKFLISVLAGFSRGHITTRESGRSVSRLKRRSSTQVSPKT